jgi:hypothetical protein
MSSNDENDELSAFTPERFREPGPRKTSPESRTNPGIELGWWDTQFAGASGFVLLVLPVCCALPAFLFALLGVVLCRTPKARLKAWIMLLISGTWMGLPLIYYREDFLRLLR